MIEEGQSKTGEWIGYKRELKAFDRPQASPALLLSMEVNMSLNKSTGNMYEWVTHTWNPITGCEFKCKYCYAQGQVNHDKPRLHKRRLIDNLGEGNTIFVCSMADMFGPWIPKSSILHVLFVCRRFSKNTYLFQSKNPKRFIEFFPLFPFNAIFGTTIETNRSTLRISKAPPVFSRAFAMSHLLPVNAKKEVTIEPIMDFDLKPLVGLINSIKPNFVAIGADSKGHNLDEPSPHKIINLIDELSRFTKVKVKRNLKRILPDLRSDTW